MKTSFWKMLENKLTIPKMQRDYAQGRSDEKAEKVRHNILDSIFSTLRDEKAMELDFVYGYESDSQPKVFYLLDGQQRMTTLFLLHWYIAVKEKVLTPEISKQLARFSYETRHDSKVFCEWLSSFREPDLENQEKRISEVIVDQPGFFASWMNDPTITSMLTMLDDIERWGKKLEKKVWSSLVPDDPDKPSLVLFNLLKMKDLGLPDELYIKMNSRGKPLTEFEYFKNRFAEILDDEDRRKEFKTKIDKEWYDVFWSLDKSDKGDEPDDGKADEGDKAKRTDDAILRFFRFLTDVLAAKAKIEIVETEDYEERSREVFNDGKNVAFLFGTLDLFAEKNRKGIIEEFFSSYFHVGEKLPTENADTLRLFFDKPEVNLLRKCSCVYKREPKNIKPNNPFILGEQMLLYTCILYMHREQQVNDFRPKLRSLRNLIRQSHQYVDYLGDYLSLIDEFFHNPHTANLYELVKEKEGKNGISLKQAAEEDYKFKFLKEHPEDRELFCEMEDTDFLHGSLVIFEKATEASDKKTYADARKYAEMFKTVFYPNQDYGKLNLAMLAIGNYTRQIDKYRLFAINKESWVDYLSPNPNKERFDESSFNRTQEILFKLFDKLSDPNNTLDTIIDVFMNENTEKWEWRRYYEHYSSFREHQKGNYTWSDGSPYEWIEQEKQKANYWNPFLLEIWKRFDDKNKLGDYNSRSKSWFKLFEYILDDMVSLQIQCVENGFLVTAVQKNESSEAEPIELPLLEEMVSRGLLEKMEAPKPSYLCKVAQTNDEPKYQIDLENRIDKGLKLLKEFSCVRAN